ncbi:hypothetical protein [Limnohabitans planktonicus]|nr:hypothetical protein [Limnohabitans planktonicus]
MRNFTAMFRGTGSFNCLMGGCSQADKLWGGAGNETEYGYAGDESVYDGGLNLDFIASNANERKKMAC